MLHCLLKGLHVCIHVCSYGKGLPDIAKSEWSYGLPVKLKKKEKAVKENILLEFEDFKAIFGREQNAGDVFEKSYCI